MFRRLTAIEIAEGALLANIAVVFQLLILYLPVGGDIFRFLIAVVFALLVLRRGLYTGVMGMCVALFIAGVLSGPGPLGFLLLEAGAGLFLGLTMKYRLPDGLLIPLGVTGGSIALYGVFLCLVFVSGQPLANIGRFIQKTYINVLSLLGFVATNAGVDGWWKHTILPLTQSITPLIPPYWWVFLFVGMWLFDWPVVIVVYYITNVSVRLLGYDVRPFPGGKIDRLMRKIVRMFIKRGIRRGFIGKNSSTQRRRRKSAA
jgi:hypothetical protein